MMAREREISGLKLENDAERAFRSQRMESDAATLSLLGPSNDLAGDARANISIEVWYYGVSGTPWICSF